ncbi:hypothetical protein B0H14DRAFT_2381537 [Mycena olivaceomarginata]|nr:hypothetical protein B0H14DRAFT_2381537 [Mycena olivaceomarginata]
MLTGVHDNQHPPEYPYTRALSAHSAVIQLYARSGQLPSAETLESRGKIGSCLCRLGCDAVESMHHVFVDCGHFADRRMNTDRRLILNAAKSLFVDDAAVWPLKISQYYLGRIPSIQTYVTSGMLPDMVKRRKLTSHLASDWHMCSIRLAGRIFGSIQRTMAARAALI